MRHNRKLAAPVLLVLALLLVGCATRNPNTVPTPAPVQVASAINDLAQVTNAAAVALRSALNQGKMSQADFDISAKVVIAVATTGKALNAELRSDDAWDIQKIKMRQIALASGLAELSKQLPSTAMVIVATCLNTFNAVSATVGGPLL
jgi:PBP1b-binding outer membrane lipoprotein LpoB